MLENEKMIEEIVSNIDRIFKEKEAVSVLNNTFCQIVYFYPAGFYEGEDCEDTIFRNDRTFIDDFGYAKLSQEEKEKVGYKLIDIFYKKYKFLSKKTDHCISIFGGYIYN